MLTDSQKRRIEGRARAMTDLPLEAGHLFYEALFEAHPEVRPLFGENLDVQVEKLIDIVFLIVHFIDGVDALTPEIEALGARHVGYGMQPAHLDTAKVALLDAFAATLDTWTAADRDAWDALLSELIAIMQHGMAQERDARKIA